MTCMCGDPYCPSCGTAQGQGQRVHAHKEIEAAKNALHRLEETLEAILPVKAPSKSREDDLLRKIGQIKGKLEHVSEFARDKSNSYTPRDWREALIRIADSLDSILEDL